MIKLKTPQKYSLELGLNWKEFSTGNYVEIKKWYSMSGFEVLYSVSAE